MMNRKAHGLTLLLALAVEGCTPSFNAGAYSHPAAGGDGGADLGAGGAGGGDGGSPFGTGDASGKPDAALDGGAGKRVMLKDDNNYVYGGWVDIPPVVVAPKSDLLFDWTNLTKDKLGHALDPKRDINMLMLLMWRLSPTMLKGKMRTDTLLERELVTAPLRFFADGTHTTAQLSQLVALGDQPTWEQILSFLDPDAYPPDSYTYTIVAVTGTDVYCGNRMVQAFQLAPGVSDTTVTLTEQSTKLVSYAYFDKLTPVEIPAGQAEVTLDASHVSVYATGAIFEGFIEAFVGHYTQSAAELAQQFTDLELLATELYRGISPDRKTIDLSTLATAKGQPFTGIDATGTWLLALRNEGCRNPTPLYLSILRPL